MMGTSYGKASERVMFEPESSEMQGDLHRFLRENHERLTGIICAYVARMGLARGENVRLLAAEVFQDAALEILAHTEHLDPTRQPHAWFLRVAANILKRKRASFAKRYRFEVLVSDLAERRRDEDENDLLDQLLVDDAPGPEQLLEAREHVEELLGLLAPADATLVCLSLVQDLSSEAIAHGLGVKPGAVRVRLHRALQRLPWATLFDLWNRAHLQLKTAFAG